MEEQRQLSGGTVFLYKGERRALPFLRRNRICKLLKADWVRKVAHIRIYVQTSDVPAVKIMHLPISIHSFLASVISRVGEQAFEMDEATQQSIEKWEARFDLNLAGYFVDSVFTAEKYATEAAGGENRPDRVIISSCPVRAPNGLFTSVQSITEGSANG